MNKVSGNVSTDRASKETSTKNISLQFLLGFVRVCQAVGKATDTMFFALFGVLVILRAIVADWDPILLAKNLAELGDAMKNLAQDIVILTAGVASVFAVAKIRKYFKHQSKPMFEIVRDSDELYGRFAAAIFSSKESICTTHMRNASFPQRSQANKAFQQSLLTWVGEDHAGQREVKRLISGRTFQEKESRELVMPAGRPTNYMVREVNWTLQTPGVNFVICDQQHAFVCFYKGVDDPSGEPRNRARIRALHLTDKDAIALLREYFDTLWEEHAPERVDATLASTAAPVTVLGHDTDE